MGKVGGKGIEGTTAREELETKCSGQALLALDISEGQKYVN